MQAASSGHKPPVSRPRTVIVPGAIAAALGTVLGTLGFFFAGFGMGTICTDFNEAAHACDPLNRWLETGFIGQWVLVLVTAVLLGIGVTKPQSRRPMAVAAWVAVAMTIAWYCFYFYSGYHSYKNH